MLLLKDSKVHLIFIPLSSFSITLSFKFYVENGNYMKQQDKPVEISCINFHSSYMCQQAISCNWDCNFSPCTFQDVVVVEESTIFT
jgi:hypothetical protein